MELDEILREMGYEDDEDLLPTIDMDDLPDVSDEVTYCKFSKI